MTALNMGVSVDGNNSDTESVWSVSTQLRSRHSANGSIHSTQSARWSSTAHRLSI